MRRFFGTCLSALAIVLIVQAAYAGIPELINCQGRLTDDVGNPVDAVVTMYFRIYNSSTAGTLLWEEKLDVDVADGLFTVQLGMTTPLPPSLAIEYSSLWMAFEVKGEPEMTPRVRITSGAFGYHAQFADTAAYAIGSSSGGWTDDGVVVRLDWSFDSVGIGTTTPVAKLHVAGDIRINAGDEMQFGSTATRVSGGANDLFLFAQDDLILNPSDNISMRPINVVNFQKPNGTSWMRVDANNEMVGIGTTAPAQMLHVDGSAIVADSFFAGAYPDDAMGVNSIIDETGFAANAGPLDLVLSSGGVREATSRAIWVPGPGYVLAFGSMDLRLEIQQGTDIEVRYAISDNSSDFSTEITNVLQIPHTLACPWRFTVTSQGWFPVSSAGEYRFYFLVDNIFNTNLLKAPERTLVLLYVPTAYGPVYDIQPSAPTSAVPPGHGAPSRTVLPPSPGINSDRVSALEAQVTELQRIVQDLQGQSEGSAPADR